MPRLRPSQPQARLVLAGLMLTGTFAALGVTSAEAANDAICQFSAHVTLSSPLEQKGARGLFSSDGPGSARCTGTLGGKLATGFGQFATEGSYGAGGVDALTGGDTCLVGSATAMFTATVPVFLPLFGPPDVAISGSEQLQRVAAALVVSGSGSVEDDPISYTGVGSFTPDSGQNCITTPISSGTLTEQLVITDRQGSNSGPAMTSTTPRGANGASNQKSKRPCRSARKSRTHGSRRSHPQCRRRSR